MIITSAQILKSYLSKEIDRSSFELKEVSFFDQDQWRIKNSVLSHQSNAFFHVCGVKRKEEERLVFYQPQGAFNGLLVCKRGEEIFILLQARIEPGNVGIGQYGPTVQSTPANYLRVHGGKETPYLDLFHNCLPSQAQSLGQSCQLDLCERYFQKTKILSYISVPDIFTVEAPFAWVSLKVIAEVLAESHFLNTDLRSMLSMFDWEALSVPKEIEALPLPDNPVSSPWRLTSLKRLKNWKISNDKISPTHNMTLPQVKMYSVQAKWREVATWFQPLMLIPREGRVILFIKKEGEAYFFLLSMQAESGAPRGYTIAPSYQVYAESPVPSVHAGSVLYEMMLSEEGGRFFKNISHYQVIMINEGIELQTNQFWVSQNKLRSLLGSSNTCSIQLRVISSMIIPLLYPEVFESAEKKKD